ncbi:MAG: hypothetical protein K0R08_2080 [Solimicrobium sp.]|nr:hypothetical protein [Solimicrobium sp.]
MQTINTHFSNPNNFSQPIEQIENKGHQIANYGMEKIYEAAHLSEDKQGSLVNVLNAMVVHFSDPTANSNSDDLQEAIAVLIMSQFDRNDLPVTDLNILLAKGIDLYKQKTNNITSFNHLPIEIHPSHHQLLSINDQRSLALTCNPQFEIYDKSWQFKLNTEGQSLSEQLRLPTESVRFELWT